MRTFDPAIVRREMQIIRNELHCDAVRITGGDRDPQRLRAAVPSLPARINAFLGEAVAAVRAKFGGRIGYASLPHEGVDWAPFDVVATDAGYLCELLDALDRSAIEAAFVNSFARYDLPHADATTTATSTRHPSASSRSSTAAARAPLTRACHGSPRPPSRRSRSTAVAGVQVVADRPTGSGQAAAVSR